MVIIALAVTTILSSNYFHIYLLGIIQVIGDSVKYLFLSFENWQDFWSNVFSKLNILWYNLLLWNLKKSKIVNLKSIFVDMEVVSIWHKANTNIFFCIFIFLQIQQIQILCRLVCCLIFRNWQLTWANTLIFSYSLVENIQISQSLVWRFFIFSCFLSPCYSWVSWLLS